MKKSDILFFLFVIALFLPFFISDTIYEWYKSFNAIHGMVMSFVKFAILATLGDKIHLFPTLPFQYFPYLCAISTYDKYQYGTTTIIL
jgi:hypothetical protein